jgi:hypothetical protein
MKWQDIIQLNDEQLLEKGIKTFTVRSELLYYFNIIKAAKVNFYFYPFLFDSKN